MFKPNELPPSTKRRVLLSTLAGAGTLTIGGAFLSHRSAELNAQAEVVSASDQNSIHRIDEVRLAVTNNEPEPIEPTFLIRHGQTDTPVAWAPDTPSPIPPQTTKRYAISPDPSSFAIPFESEALLTIKDNHSEKKATQRLGPFRAKSPPPILNPSFAAWLPEQNNQFTAPFRWYSAVEDRGADKTVIKNRGGSCHLSTSAIPRETGPWAMAGISQNARLPSLLEIEATPYTIATPDKTPPMAAGIEIADGDKRVWIVFGDVERQRTVYRGGDLSYILTYVPASKGERVSASVDIPELYQNFNWRLPEPQRESIDGVEYTTRPARVLIFAAVYPSAPPSAAASATIHKLRTEPLTKAGKGHTDETQ